VTTTFPTTKDDYSAVQPTASSPRNNPSLATNIVNLQDAMMAVQDLLLHFTEKVTRVSASGASYAINFTTGNNFDITLSAACTFSFSNPPAAGRVGTIFVILRNTGTAYAATWPASVKWAGGVAPTLSGVNKADLLSFITVDGGVTYAGMSTQDFSGVGTAP